MSRQCLLWLTTISCYLASYANGAGYRTSVFFIVNRPTAKATTLDSIDASQIRSASGP